MIPTKNPRIWSMARKHMWGQVYEPLDNDQWPHNTRFCRKEHEKPFSIIPKANTYDFLANKWSPSEIQECDLWQGNICGWGVRASGRWSMATQPPFLSKIAMNDYFQWHWRLTPTNFWPRNGLHHKSKNVIYGKESYVLWGVWAFGRRSMATQPPFCQK